MVMTRLTPRRQDGKNLGLEELRLACLRLRRANQCPHSRTAPEQTQRYETSYDVFGFPREKELACHSTREE